MDTVNTLKSKEASSSLKKDVDGDPQQKTPKNNTNQETGVSPRFLVVKRTEGDFTKVNPFIIEKTIYSFIGSPKNVRKIKDGLLIETTSAAQSRRLLELKTLGEFPVEVIPHQSLNTSRGVIYCPDLLNCSTEEILEGLKDQGVIEVRRIKVRKEGNLVDSPNHILTFNNPALPKRVKAAFYSLQVRMYVPPPMRCFRCQKFGHTSLRCSEEQVCVCGKPLHEGRPCEEPISCVNCQGPHSARSRNCPIYKQEAAIQELKTKENISYIEAKKKVIVTTPNPNVSYAAATASPTKIDFSSLIEQLVPKIVEALSSVGKDGEIQSTSMRQVNVTLPKIPSTRQKETLSKYSSDKRKRGDSPEQVSLSSGDESSLSSAVADLRKKPKKRQGWPKGKPRKQSPNLSAPSVP